VENDIGDRTFDLADLAMQTGLCHQPGIAYPIISAPMGPDITGPYLVAAVSNVGGLGMLQAQLRAPPPFRDEIRRVRAHRPSVQCQPAPALSGG
jgi:NAD(P)H-dependent flavin oxidoreductase YrpB (nitropropane dioxygenase family)